MLQGWVVLEHQELGLLLRPAKRKGLMRWQPMALCDAAAEGRVDDLRLEFGSEKNPWENGHIESTALGELLGLKKDGEDDEVTIFNLEIYVLYKLYNIHILMFQQSRSALVLSQISQIRVSTKSHSSLPQSERQSYQIIPVPCWVKQKSQPDVI